MTAVRTITIIAAVAALSACYQLSDPSPQTAAADDKYTTPEDSGLVGVRPYPDADSVCQVIGENALTVDLLDHTRILIGCPTIAKQAIAERQAEGAEIVSQAGDWTLLSVPATIE